MKTKPNFAVTGLAGALLLFGASSLALAQGTLFVVDDAVGIGTETINPGSKLHVLSDTTGPVDGIFLENMGGPSRIKLTNRSITNSPTENQEWQLNSNGLFRISRPGGGTQFTIDAAGLVTAKSGYTVDGTPLNVPDYVFESDYALRPLDEVRNFVNENGHLPDVPNADQIAKEGLNMTEMQLLLLQKVEELTLYTLQQQEKIERLETQLSGSNVVED